jgi:putative restriction endonuclease
MWEWCCPDAGGFMLTPEPWLGKMSRLRIDRARGAAPHKPLLLLVLLEMAEQDALPHEVLPLSPELAFRFLTYWTVVAHRRSQAGDVRLPFHHLSGDGFWAPLTADGRPSPDRDLTSQVSFAPGFFEVICDAGCRDQMRRLLIAKYFQPEERAALYTLCGMLIPADEEIQRDAAYRPMDEAIKQGREIRFRLNVVAAYNYTCALTAYRLTTISAGSIVDAAHIHQFSNSRNNDPRNGMALCKNAHWLFDQGLWTVSDDFRVVVAIGAFCESSPDGKALAEYHGQPLRLPTDHSLWPSPEHLAWHRKHKFQRCA